MQDDARKDSLLDQKNALRHPVIFAEMAFRAELVELVVTETSIILCTSRIEAILVERPNSRMLLHLPGFR